MLTKGLEETLVAELRTVWLANPHEVELSLEDNVLTAADVLPWATTPVVAAMPLATAAKPAPVIGGMPPTPLTPSARGD
jgi:hypothetical protein